MIYLASPYSAPDVAVIIKRWEETCSYVASVLEQGLHIYSPIVHCHYLKAYIKEDTWEFWKRHDAHMIHLCSEVYVLTLDGWETSVGVTWEIEFAHLLHKPVKYVRWNKALGMYLVS